MTLDIDPGELIWMAPSDIPGGGVTEGVDVEVGGMGEAVKVDVALGVTAAAVCAADVAWMERAVR